MKSIVKYWVKLMKLENLISYKVYNKMEMEIINDVWNEVTNLIKTEIKYNSDYR